MANGRRSIYSAWGSLATPGTTTPIKPGDIVEVEIEGIGVLKNPVAAR